jgi:hypothetical protein
VGLALAVLTTGLLSPVQEAQAAFPGGNGLIAVSGIDILEADGARWLAPPDSWGRGGGQHPAWSADGRSIAYVRGLGGLGDGGTEIRVVSVDGTDRLITHSSDARHIEGLSWAPSGEALVFSAEHDGADGEPRSQLWLVNRDGSGLRRLTSELVGSSHPAWSPGGSKIAFHRGSDLFMIDPDGSNEQQLTFICEYPADQVWWGPCEEDAPPFTEPDWHPHGDRLVFSSGYGGGTGLEHLRDLYTMTIGGRPSRIPGTRGAFAPAWSPDGTRIVFEAPRDGDWRNGLYTVAPDGSGRSGDLRTFDAVFADADWQPCPDGVCPVFPPMDDGDEDEDDCVEVSRSVGSGGPHVVEVVLPAGRAVVTFSGVSPAGSFTIAECSDGELGAGIFARYELSSSFSFGSAEVCLPYDEDAARRAGLRESEIDLIHDGSDGLRVVTTRRDADANFVCGQVSSFSSFFLGAGAVGRSIELACPPGEVPEGGFVDVSSSSPHAEAIGCLVWWEITRGLDAEGTRYGPQESVSRGQMATFMARTIERSGGRLPAAGRDWFTDDEGSVHEDAINRLRQAGVISGTSATTFSPGRSVTRAQMATFLRNTLEFRSGESWGSQMDYFSDDEGNTHEDAINAVAAAGVTRGTDGLTAYSPAREVTRAQMASFITRMLDLLVDDGHTPPRT